MSPLSAASELSELIDRDTSENPIVSESIAPAIVPPSQLDHGLDHQPDDSDSHLNSADLNAELDELIARADTFIHDLDGDQSAAANYFVRPTPPKYFQGVVRGQQAYITTNLMDNESIAVMQPQMVWSLGRNREAGIPIKDKMMSRRHAVILYVREENAFYMLDLNSMNGSYVNGQRLSQRQRLQDGDFLRVGNTEFFFFISQQHESLESIHPEIYAKLVTATQD
jgi:hypothetical protein